MHQWAEQDHVTGNLNKEKCTKYHTFAPAKKELSEDDELSFVEAAEGENTAAGAESSVVGRVPDELGIGSDLIFPPIGGSSSTTSSTSKTSSTFTSKNYTTNAASIMNSNSKTTYHTAYNGTTSGGSSSVRNGGASTTVNHRFLGSSSMKKGKKQATAGSTSKINGKTKSHHLVQQHPESAVKKFVDTLYSPELEYGILKRYILKF